MVDKLSPFAAGIPMSSARDDGTAKPKFSYRDSSIRVKLLILMALIASMALLLAGVSLLAYETLQYRREATREMSTLAEIGSVSSVAALTFKDQSAASETLTAFRADPRIIQAAVYDQNDQIFATYESAHPPDHNPSPAQPRQTGEYFGDGDLMVFRPVILRGERIGTFYLRSDLNDIYARLLHYGGIVGIVLLASLGLALLFSFRIQATISGPIVALASVAALVSASKNYSVRAVKAGNDEIGVLIDGFNEMLSQIELRDQDQKIAEEKLRESEERYALAAHGSNDGLWDWKLDTNEIYLSPRWMRMLGYSDHEITTPEEWLDRIHPNDRNRVRAQLAAHCEGKTPEFSSEYRIRHRNGQYLWMLSRGIAVRDKNGVAVRIAGSQTDINEAKIADTLTDLPNRLYLIDKLETAIEAKGNPGVSPFAVLFIDLDRFKVVNDSLGHTAGDQLLVGVAQRLRSSVRGQGDSGRLAGSGATVARLSGDEFAILVEGIPGKDEAVIIAERIIKHLGASFYLDGRQVFVTASIGVAMGSSGDTPEDLLRNADTAMYYAKSHGRGRYEMFEQDMRDRAVARIELEKDMKKALACGEFVLYYQPKVSLTDQRITGFEALVRWKHPTRGILYPSEFIPVAEETGLIIPLGLWILREACRQMAAWHRSVVRKPVLSISVNISFRQLAEASLADDVARILAETGLDPTTLRLEMTESSIMENLRLAAETLERFKKMYIGLEIDDFGTGYSSLSYLRQLPFDTVKIDQSFVKELGSADDTSEIVRTIMRLATSLGMGVVAEGVETEDQLARLTAMGCSVAQGYYFSRPVDADRAHLLILDKDSLQRGIVLRPALGIEGLSRATAALAPAPVPVLKTGEAA